MGEKSYRLSANVCALPAADADKLISAGDGDSALLYIYLLRRGEAPDAELAAALGMDERRISAAAERLRGMGLLSAAALMNAVILTSVLSAGNSGLYASTRMLFVLAHQGSAPKIFGKLSASGVPRNALFATTAVAGLCFLTSLFDNQSVYLWLLNTSGMSGFIAWLGTIGNTAICVLLLVIAGFLMRKNGNSFVSLAKTFKDGIPWETMMILAFAVVATSALTNAGTGIKDQISAWLTPLFGEGTGTVLFVFLIILLSAIITNFIGNLVVGLMFVPIVVAFASSAGVAQNLVVAIAVTTNMSLFLPSGSPLAALLHSNTEWCTSNDIYKYSWPIVFAGVVACFIITLTLGNLVF